MADRPKVKKPRLLPPVAPRNQVSRSSLTTEGGHLRSQSLPSAGEEQAPLLSKQAHARSANPTPKSANRGTLPSSVKSRPNRIPSLDLQAPFRPRTGPTAIPNYGSSDSEHTEITERDSLKRKRSYPVFHVDLDDGVDNLDGLKSGKEGKEKETFMSGSDSGLNGVGLDSDEERLGRDVFDEGPEKEKAEKGGIDAGEESSDEEEGPQGNASQHAPVRSKASMGGSLTSNPGPRVEGVKEETEAGKESLEVATAFNASIVKKHVLKCMLNACGLEKAQDAGRITPRFGPDKRRIYLNNGVLIPDLGQSFSNEWALWGTHALNIVKDISQMDSQDAGRLSGLPDEVFKKAIKDGVFASMKTAWKKHDKGIGEAWAEGRRKASKDWARRDAKSNNRYAMLVLSGLPVAHIKPVVNANCQSDEDDDPDDKNGRIVKVPAYRAEIVNELLGAFDVAFSVTKQRTGNPKVETHKYVVVNIPVTRLKDGDPGLDLDVDNKKRKKPKKRESECKNYLPRWAVSAEWEAANPQLEMKSQYHIDATKTEVPELAKIKNYINRYQPKKRTYETLSSSSSIVIPAPAVSDPTPTVCNPIDKALPDDEPGFAAEFSENSAPMVDPTPGITPGAHTSMSTPPEHPTTECTGPPAPTRTPTDPLILPLTSAEPKPPTPAVHPPTQPANPNPGGQSLLGNSFGLVMGSHNHLSPGAGAQPGFPQWPFAQGFYGQPLYTQDADGQFVLVHMGNQPTMPGYGGGVVSHMGIPIDPSLLEKSDPPHPPNDMPPPPLNDMPPPPELVEPTPEPSEAAELPANSSSGRGKGRGRGSRGRGKGRGRSTKLKAVIEEGDDDEKELENGPPVAGPSQPVPNTGKAKKITLTVRGS